MTSSLDMIRGRSNVVTLTNKSGGPLVAGDVCVIDTANDEAATTTTSAASVLKVYIAAESIADNATGRFYSAGFCPLVTPSASTTRGRYLFTHTVAKQAAESATYGAGAFGVILKSGTTPSVWLFGTTAQGSGGGVARSGSTTDEHLAVWNGSNADSIKDGGVVPAAGGRTLIAESTPAGGTTASFTSIPGTYKKLIVEGMIRSTQSATNVNGMIELNTDTTAANYRYVEIYEYGAATAGGDFGNDRVYTTAINAATATANEFSMVFLEIVQYANTAFNKQVAVRIYTKRDTSSVFNIVVHGIVSWANTAAITQIDLKLSAGNYATNSVLRLYGES